MALCTVDINKVIKETSLLSHCVCIEFNNKIYKFKITFGHMDIVNLIENYISILDKSFFTLKSEHNLTNKTLGKKFYPYLGNYRLKGKLKATDNYLEPPSTGILEILFSIYTTSTLNSSDFLYIVKVYELSECKKAFIKNFFDKANIELFDMYTLEDFNTSLNFLDNIDAGIRLNDAYFFLKNLLVESKENNKRINELGINDKFIEAIEKGCKKNSPQKKHI